MSDRIRIGIIGGSGVEAALGIDDGKSVSPSTPFGRPSAPLTVGTWEGVDVVVVKRHGEHHELPPGNVPYRANIFALKQLGVTHVIATGATGSLREDIGPGDVVIADQVIDRTRHRPSSFYESAAVHVALAEPFCPVMRKWLIEAGQTLESTRLHEKGTYVCMEGPAFSTRAESHMHREMGGDLIGMTCMPEAKLAREAELAYALIALPTDYDCWREQDDVADPRALLEEIIGNLEAATEASLKIIRAALANVSPLQEQASPAHDALALAIWTDRSKIDPAEVERLEPLWGRYFDDA